MMTDAIFGQILPILRRVPLFFRSARIPCQMCRLKQVSVFFTLANDPTLAKSLPRMEPTRVELLVLAPGYIQFVNTLLATDNALS
jgi:hypothetical protein